MAFPHSFHGVGDPPIQSLLNIGVGNFRLATGIIPQIQQVQAPGFAAHTLEQARIQELETARAIGMEHRVRLMLESRAQQQQQAQQQQAAAAAAAAELAFRNEAMSPEIESAYPDNKGGYRSDRREKDREREGRSRDDRDRGRDRDKRRHDDRDRWNDQDGGRDRSRHGSGRDRSSNRDRSPIRSGRSDDDFGSQGDRAYDDERDRYRSRDSESRGDGDKWVTNQPSRTIILRGLSLDVDSKMIGAELMVLGLPVKEIRLIRSASGVSRGFAFVEFHNAEDAKRWMDHTQGTLMLQNQYRAYMDYSFRKERQGPRDLQRNDWVCFKCMAHNFKRRDYCYNCNLPRKESEKNKTPDGQDEIGTNPCNTLIFRGLDALTTEEGLVTALNQALPSSLAPIKNIAIIRDELNTSRGFGFVEFHSVAASTQMLDALSKMEPLLEVDGKQLMINYAKNSFNTTMATIQQQQSSQYYDNYYQQQQQSGQYYDPNTQQYYDYSQYYNNQSTSSAVSPSAGSATTTTATKGNSTNAAAAVAQAAIQQAQAHKHYKQPQTSASTQQTAEYVTVNGVEYPIYPPPDTSSYQYDETSGYYYDPLTQLYYDANSQYYYNGTTGHYMYWDAEKSTYLPAPTGAEDMGSPDDKNKKDGKDKKDKEKSKMAKKIAKDMEKWAKSMNAQKDAMKGGGKPFGMGSGLGFQESATADAGFAMLTKAKEDKSLMPPPPLMGGADREKQAAGGGGGKPGLVASYGGDSDSGDEDDSAGPVDESKLVDWTKLACLLCKRQFQSKEILNKHTQFSDLHKQNLEQLNLARSASSADKIEYRDRAKERRQKYGAPEPPEPRRRKGGRDFSNDGGEASAPVPFEEPTKFGIGGDNIGNKLLQKMGWSHGQGLGKANQGRTDPIAAERRNASAGLGARGGKVVAEAGDSYREALKKTMYARYNEMD